MAKTISEKLKIKAGAGLYAMNAPADFARLLGPLPKGAQLVSNAKNPDQVHWFVTNKKQFDREIDAVMKLLGKDTIIWIYFPKGTSVLQTDLSRDKGWDSLNARKEPLTWISLISFDETWSAFGIRLGIKTDRPKQGSTTPREILNWIDAATKEVRLPDDLALAFKKAPTAAAFFSSLSFTNRKEYVEWVVTAKRAETRQERVAGTLDRLGKKWKNPRNL